MISRLALALTALLFPIAAAAQTRVLTGHEAYGDWRADAPGVRRHIRASDLPAPMATPSTRNSVSVVKPRDGAQLKVPAGFAV
jgi:hypothetical protein